MLKARIVYPFLFGLYPVLFLFSHNIGKLSIFEQKSVLELAGSIGVTICGVWLLWLLMNSFYKNPYKSGIVVSIIISLFFFYGHKPGLLGVGILRVLNIKEQSNNYYGLFLTIWKVLVLVFLTFCFYALHKTRRDISGSTRILNLIAMVLVIIPTVNIAAYETRRAIEVKQFKIGENKTFPGKEIHSPGTKAGAALPDIYYIILDQYAAASVIQENAQYDNSPFLDSLRAKGFFIASQSRSNYAYTALSLASSLNMEYLNYVGDRLGRKSKDLKVLGLMVEHNNVMMFLKEHGYACINLRSMWSPSKWNRYADQDIKCAPYLTTGFLRLMLETSPLKFLTESDGPFRETTLCQFSELARLKRADKPLFVFAHIVAPHWPYIFGTQGEQVSTADKNKKPEKELWVDQCKFVNNKVEELVGQLLAKPGRPPIIIFQGDHGLWVPWTSSWTDTFYMKTKMRIFNTYYFPPGDTLPLYSSITPVNTFRIIFNHYFGTNYPVLDDRSYYSHVDFTPYKIRDVTALTK